MSWQPVDFSAGPSGTRRKAEPLEKRLRFYVDETIGPDVVERLRRIGANLVVGRHGLADEAHAQEALRQRRFIVTNDRDFLNDRKFPRGRFYGVVVIPDKFGSCEDHERVLTNLARLARWRADLSGVKFQVIPATITAYFGEGAKLKLRVADGQLFEWIDDPETKAL